MANERFMVRGISLLNVICELPLQNKAAIFQFKKPSRIFVISGFTRD
jgi:hypothetical protein